MSANTILHAIDSWDGRVTAKTARPAEFLLETVMPALRSSTRLKCEVPPCFKMSKTVKSGFRKRLGRLVDAKSSLKCHSLSIINYQSLIKFWSITRSKSDAINSKRCTQFINRAAICTMIYRLVLTIALSLLCNAAGLENEDPNSNRQLRLRMNKPSSSSSSVSKVRGSSSTKTTKGSKSSKVSKDTDSSSTNADSKESDKSMMKMKKQKAAKSQMSKQVKGVKGSKGNKSGIEMDSEDVWIPEQDSEDAWLERDSEDAVAAGTDGDGADGPTDMPTASPTLKPTSSPTLNPTPSPTMSEGDNEDVTGGGAEDVEQDDPTLVPTTNPVVVSPPPTPSIAPTGYSSAVPTSSESLVPDSTQVPSVSPSPTSVGEACDPLVDPECDDPPRRLESHWRL